MKKLITVLTLLAPFYCFAQIPMGLNYQAIAWDNNNLPKALKSITITVNILKGPNEKTDIEFTETQTATTNELGLFTITIGSVNPNGFQAINWAAIPKYLHVIIDGIPSAPTPMLSVPYAMYAENTTLKAGKGIHVSGNTITNTGDADSDATNELQKLTLEGDVLKLSQDGGEIPILTNLKEGPGILVSGNTISNTGDGDSDATNEIQRLSYKDNRIELSKDGGSVILPADLDRDSINELQKIKLENNLLSLSKNGGEVPIPSQNYSYKSFTANVGLSVPVNGNARNISGVAYTIPEDGVYLALYKFSLNFNGNQLLIVKMQISGSVSGDIYNQSFSKTSQNSFYEITDFNMINLKKNELVRATYTPTSTASNDASVTIRLDRLILIKIE